MERYVKQLLTDIEYATENVSWPFTKEDTDLRDWISAEEEDKTAPVRELEAWTGISKEALPPVEKLTDTHVRQIVNALKNMLDAYNWSFVLQQEVPERIQYATIREYFDQQVKVKQWHQGFFELCRPNTDYGKCTLGEYCQCAFYADLFSGCTDEKISAEEERANALEIEIAHLKRKYESDWMRYYPYHLDPAYDDENGNPYNYGFDDDPEEDEDSWWKK